ncbi:serine/threonine-protein kinase [Catenulispora pinisilvae]|uniref:serine/threonine-protein kinase n=1 Tax=Catenulispora pinisilvae TaxID=2705253 RepID=UPI00189232F3|nr:serine/threonine-protein kinase [Catenulispora pinisilvae]
MARFQRADPEAIGPYQVQRLLGAGGMGRVYLGVDQDGSQAAVKVVNADLLQDAEFRRRFTREASATSRVSGRFVAGVIAFDLDAPEPWLATEFIDGPPLSDVVAERGPLAPAQAQAVAAGLAEALVTIHDAGLVHRDVKPANVLLAANGPHLIDFGIARESAASTITRTGVVVGTPPYMAPEQIRGRSKVGPPADVFALGGVLCFAVTGRHPFGEADPTTLSYRIAHEEPDLDGIEDEPILALIATCLAKKPDDRPTAPALRKQISSMLTRPVMPVVAPRPVPLAQEATEPMPEGPESGSEAESAAGNAEAAQPDDSATVPDDPAPIAASSHSPATDYPSSPNLPNRRRVAIALAATLAVIVGAGLIGTDLMQDGNKNSRHGLGPDHAGGSTPSASPTTPAGSGTPSSSAGSPAPPTGSHSSSVPPGPLTTVSSAPDSGVTGPPDPPPTTVVVTDPRSTVTTSTSGHSTPPPHPTSQPIKPPTSAPPSNPQSNPTPPGNPPQAPTGQDPTVDADMSGYTVTFTWSTVPGVTSYQVHYTLGGVAPSPDPRTIDVTVTVTGTTYHRSDDFGGYPVGACFLVRAVNAYGVSAWDSTAPHCI